MTSAPYAAHVGEESARRAVAAAENDSGSNSSSMTIAKLIGRLLLYLLFPSLMGCFGVLVTFLDKSRRDGGGANGSPKEIDFERDFGFPFLLSLAMVVVIGFQTGGFRSKEVKPAVVWPKVRRTRKVVRRTVVVDDEGNVVEEREEEEVPEKNGIVTKAAKKKD